MWGELISESSGLTMKEEDHVNLDVFVDVHKVSEVELW